MNERIKQLAEQAGATVNERSGWTYYGTIDLDVEKFAELIVRMCADAADMYEGNGYYVGDCVAEYMGYGQEEGVTEWRSK
jgi:hypothetical protein